MKRRSVLPGTSWRDTPRASHRARLPRSSVTGTWHCHVVLACVWQLTWRSSLRQPQYGRCDRTAPGGRISVFKRTCLSSRVVELASLPSCFDLHVKPHSGKLPRNYEMSLRQFGVMELLALCEQPSQCVLRRRCRIRHAFQGWSAFWPTSSYEVETPGSSSMFDPRTDSLPSSHFHMFCVFFSVSKSCHAGLHILTRWQGINMSIELCAPLISGTVSHVAHLLFTGSCGVVHLWLEMDALRSG